MCVGDCMVELDNIKQSIENHAKRLDEHKSKLKSVEESVEYQGKLTNDILKEFLLKLDEKFSELNESMCMKILDLDTHRRK